jgi:hypothetical protein
MSRGPGKIERQIANLFRKSGRWENSNQPSLDRSYTVTDLCVAIFPIDRQTRVQRVSVLRSAHAALRRARKANELKDALRDEAYQAAYAKFGQPPKRWSREHDELVSQFVNQHPSYLASERIAADDIELFHWRATEMPDRTVVFHHYSRPARVWAVNIGPAGIAWAEAEIAEITSDRVSVVYNGIRCPLDRSTLGFFGALWRGVRFASERTGWTAAWFEQRRREWYGHRSDFQPEAMVLEEARRIIGLQVETYTRDDIIATFRRAAKRCHPDLGGTAEMFRKLVEARDRLLASIGSSAPAPKMPDFYPSGMRVVYRSRTGRRPRIGNDGGIGRLSTV